MSDARIFMCNYCDMPCKLVMYGMGIRDDEEIELKCCPYDGTDYNKNSWKEVKE